ncbi:26S proteasome complex ubiquitin subunit Rpn13 [Chlorella sorokiniana]|uniref:26S proteasome complex ubiquitin subunit Rpn13 n=1 Tax=Chlorella sorokiniana TaxID=3076 RepID=A0A2P6TZW7_CHLSO|nr:26S proteasome complex ubiquitin subunit Rpn13 [Chlorella sorokiniana]|eukprot:PRW59590.1 26S proteasome complex ubiquitin subunit Rpn13 [Chlorella sorokiniana]
MGVAAAAAAGLTPELAATFAALLPLEARREAFLRRLLECNQFTAAAAFMATALRVAGLLPPAAC